MMPPRRAALLAVAGMALQGPHAAQVKSPGAGLGWFAWTGQPWLDQPQAMLARLPGPSSSVLLALDGAQLRSATSPGGASPVRRLISLAAERGVEVELLLGDPEWVRPPARARLMELLAGVRQLPFAGLNLDLERSQSLGGSAQEWREGVLETVRQARAATGWPITLTTHSAELADPGFLGRLSHSGAATAIAMAYVSYPHLAEERAQRILHARDAAGMPLQIGLAQSIESQLARGESWHHYGRERALREWLRLAARLERHGGFAGITIQSFEAFDVAPP